MESTLHFVNNRPLFGPYPDGLAQIWLGMGCFWGAERLFWQTGGVWVTSVGYGGGAQPNPNYEQVCTGHTGHAELVHVVFSPDILPLAQLIKIFFENHDPTQGDRQGNDIGSQYRSVIFANTARHHAQALASKARYDEAYLKAGHDPTTTEVLMYKNYFPAEDYHQQYLAKNPAGYCSLKGTGVVCASG